MLTKYLRFNYIVLYTILLTGVIMRFWGYSSWSLSNDELSAVTRSHFSSISELIQYGVYPDFHPAGIQVLIYFLRILFNDSETIIRFPFVLAGIASLLLYYKTSKQWFNNNTALMSTAFFAAAAFPILYSQLARPYSFGLLGTLMLAYTWKPLLFGKPKIYHIAIASLGYIICIYSHYFAGMMAGIIGITGIFFLNNNNYKTYLSAAVIACFTYIPHIGISLSQFSKGGVGSWLGPPEEGYLSKFIHYGFNNSNWLLILVLLLVSAGLFYNKKPFHHLKDKFILLIWFLLPFYIGFYYSVYINPVLQYSTLLFSFPFGILLLFSFVPSQKEKLYSVLSLLLLAGTMFSTVYEKQFYKKKEFGVFKDLVVLHKKTSSDFGENNITAAYNCISPRYIEYYQKKENYFGKYTFLRADSSTAEPTLTELVQTSESPYFIYAWTNIMQPDNYYEIIQNSYNKIVYDSVFYNSRFTIFKKDSTYKRAELFSMQNNMESLNNTDTLNSYSGIRSYELNAQNEYSPGVECTIKSIAINKTKRISVYGMLMPVELANYHLVIQIQNNSDSIYFWQSAQSIKQNCKTGKWNKVVHLFQLPEGVQSEDKLKVYFWNPEKKKAYVDDIKIVSYEM